LTGTVNDSVRDPTQRNYRAGKKRCRLRQPAETRGDPAAVTLRKVLGIGNRTARRDGQDRFAVTRMDSQGIAARAPVPAKPDRIDLRAMFDQKPRRLVGPPIKERASGHVCKSGDQKFARILPYPPPGKSLGAKTNHLPNIQGSERLPTLQNGVGTQKIG